MLQYTLLFEPTAKSPRCGTAFSAETPAHAFVLAQRRPAPAHLFANGSYLCTLECAGSFWIISNDAVGAQRYFAQASTPRTVRLAEPLGKSETQLVRRAMRPHVIKVSPAALAAPLLVPATS